MDKCCRDHSGPYKEKRACYMYIHPCVHTFFCLQAPVSPSASIVAGTNLLRTLAPQPDAADTRLILQAQLPNANPPRMYLEFVKG